MTAQWLPVSRRASRFADALDGRLPADRLPDEDARFLAIVGGLRDLDAPVMRPDFASDLRSSLMLAAPAALAELAAAAGVRTTAPDAHQVAETRRRRALRTAAATTIALAAATGVGVASQSALPGDPLYSVKRSIERVDVAISTSESSKGQKLIDQADTRLSEVDDLLADRGSDASTPGFVEQALDDFSAESHDAATALTNAYVDDSDERAITDLRVFTADAAQHLHDLTPLIPSQAADELLTAAETLTDIDSDAQQTCPSCSDLEPLDLEQDVNALQRLVDKVAGSALPGSDSPSVDPRDLTVPPVSVPSGVVPTGVVPPSVLPSDLLPQTRGPGQTLDPTNPGQGPGPGPTLPGGNPPPLPTGPGPTGPGPTAPHSPSVPGPKPTSPNPTVPGGPTVTVPGGPTVTVPHPTVTVPHPTVTVPTTLPTVTVPTVTVPTLPTLPVPGELDGSAED